MRRITKKILWIFIVLSALLFFLSNSFAQNDWRWDYWWSPMKILEKVYEESNEWIEIQETMLNNANDQEWWYSRQYKIANTLDYIRLNIAPYLQRATYIWLIVAVILIIYNWFLMVTNSIHKQWDIAKVKKNLMNITIWVLLLTWFYALIKIVVWLINSIFGWYGWSTWF